MKAAKRKVVLQVVTNSELETWRTCGAKHGYMYEELLRPKVDALPLAAGDVLHEAAAAGWMAAWAEPDVSTATRLELAVAGAISGLEQRLHERLTALREMAPHSSDEDERIAAAIERLEGEREALMWAVPHYFRSAAPDLAYVPLFVEAEFALPVPIKTGRPSMVIHKGKRDLVLWDRELNRLIVQDHKGTAANVRSMEAKLPLDTQLSGYVFALRSLLNKGINHFLGAMVEQAATPAGALEIASKHRDELAQATVGAVALNVMRRDRPSEPKINLLTSKAAVTENQKALFRDQQETGRHHGEVSVAECDTTPETYAEALIAQVSERELLITEKQRAFLAKLKDKGDTFFAQLEYYRGADELGRWRSEVLIDAAAIREARRRGRSRNPGACSMPWSPRCAYASICLNPDDPTVRSDYVVVDGPHQELKKEEQTNGQEYQDTF